MKIWYVDVCMLIYILNNRIVRFNLKLRELEMRREKSHNWVLLCAMFNRDCCVFSICELFYKSYDTIEMRKIDVEHVV